MLGRRQRPRTPNAPDSARPQPSTPFDAWGDPALIRVWRVLNRVAPIEARRELYNGLDEKTRRPPLEPGPTIAIGFDTNAIFRLAAGKQPGADALDYLRVKHRAPVLIPGQAVQEIWNNLLAGLEQEAKALRTHYAAFTAEVNAIGANLGEAGAAVQAAVENLVEAHGDWIDEASDKRLNQTLEAFEKAVTGYVPRAEFWPLARVRHETKTPPGFKDDAKNHGDFFVWADFLYSAAQADLGGVTGIAFVTADTKLDWSRRGRPHPILAAEATQLTGLPFRLWSLKDFHAHVRAV